MALLVAATGGLMTGPVVADQEGTLSFVGSDCDDSNVAVDIVCVETTVWFNGNIPDGDGGWFFHFIHTAHCWTYVPGGGECLVMGGHAASDTCRWDNDVSPPFQCWAQAEEEFHTHVAHQCSEATGTAVHTLGATAVSTDALCVF